MVGNWESQEVLCNAPMVTGLEGRPPIQMHFKADPDPYAEILGWVYLPSSLSVIRQAPTCARQRSLEGGGALRSIQKQQGTK